LPRKCLRKANSTQNHVHWYFKKKCIFVKEECPTKCNCNFGSFEISQRNSPKHKIFIQKTMYILFIFHPFSIYYCYNNLNENVFRLWLNTTCSFHLQMCSVLIQTQQTKTTVWMVNGMTYKILMEGKKIDFCWKKIIIW
jgi:hypothetical protein